VPNQPKTPNRTVRVGEVWEAARATADERGESVSNVVRAALEAYVRDPENFLGAIAPE
jgi:hypothetical protein